MTGGLRWDGSFRFGLRRRGRPASNRSERTVIATDPTKAPTTSSTTRTTTGSPPSAETRAGTRGGVQGHHERRNDGRTPKCERPAWHCRPAAGRVFVGRVYGRGGDEQHQDCRGDEDPQQSQADGVDRVCLVQPAVGSVIDPGGGHPVHSSTTTRCSSSTAGGRSGSSLRYVKRSHRMVTDAAGADPGGSKARRPCAEPGDGVGGIGTRRSAVPRPAGCLGPGPAPEARAHSPRAAAAAPRRGPAPARTPSGWATPPTTACRTKRMPKPGGRRRDHRRSGPGGAPRRSFPHRSRSRRSPALPEPERVPRPAW